VTEKGRKKGREGREKVAERKMGNMHLIETFNVFLNAAQSLTEKGRKRTGRARKVTERKMVNKHLLEHTRLPT
jgi:hypothetical protein